MPAYQVAGLCKGAVGSTEYQYGRCTERTYQEYIIHIGKPCGLYTAYQGYGYKCTYESPDMIFGFYQCLPINHIFGNPVSTLQFLFQCYGGMITEKLQFQIYTNSNGKI